MKKTVISSFMYDKQKGIRYTKLELNELGEVINKKELFKTDLQGNVLMNLNAIIEYIFENHKHEVISYEIVYESDGEVISYTYEEAEHVYNKHTFIITDDEVKEWIKVVKRYLI